MALAATTRRRLAIVLDALATLLLLLTSAIVYSDGFVTRIAGIRVSLRTPGRALLWLAIVIVVRIVLERRIGPFAIPRSRWQQLARADADSVVLYRAAGLWKRTALAALGIGGALAVLLHVQLAEMYSVADLGDPLFSIWRIGWVLHQIVIDPSHLFDANIFYPQPLTLTLSDPIILPALTAAPLLAAGVHPVVAYNLLMLSAFWLSGVATYLLVERLTGSPRAALIAGLMYACYSYRFDHYGHLELQMTQWMPLALLALHLFLSTGRWPYIVAMGLAGVAQLYSSMYYAVFFLIYAAAIGLGLLMIYRPPIRRLLLPVAATAVLSAVIAIPIARAFIAAQPIKGDRGIGEVTLYSAEPIDYLRANRHSAVWYPRLLPPVAERGLFPGLAPLALGALGLAPPFSALRLVYTAGLAVAFEGSLGYNGTFYPYLYRWLSPIRGIRSPARFAAIVGLSLSILAGFGARRVLAWGGSRLYQNAIFALLLAGIMLDAWPTLALAPVWRTPPPIYQELPNQPRVLAEFPIIDNEVWNIPYMYFSIWHWSPMVNGYSGFVPDSYHELRKELTGFPDATSIAALHRHKVTHVTVNCAIVPEGCDALIEQMRHSDQLRLISDAQWSGQPVALYELTGK